MRALDVVAKATGASFEFEPAPGRRRRHRRARASRCPRPTLALCQRSARHPVRRGGRAQVGPPAAGAAPRARAPRLCARSSTSSPTCARPRAFPMLVDASPLKRSVVEGTDLMVIRELTGGLYFGEPRGRRGVRRRRARARSTPWPTRRGRSSGWRGLAFDVAHEAAEAADLGGQGQRARRVAALARGRHARGPATIPTSQLDHVLVDNCAMALVHKPTQFDTIVTENTFGDILSDEAAILAGSMGMLPSASLGGSGRPVGALRAGARHGARHRGPGVANPIAAILSAGMLLRYSLDRGRGRRAGRRGGRCDVLEQGTARGTSTRPGRSWWARRRWAT